MAKKVEAGEREILQGLRSRNARRPGGAGVRIGIGDDCAVLTPRAGEEMLVTTDFSIEGRHFRHDWHEPEAVGHKCLARGLSDLAAMGARPVAAFVSLAVPRALAVSPLSKKAHVSGTKPFDKPTAGYGAPAAGASKRSWMDRFYDGLLALADREGVTLAGGDLSESPALAVADIVLVGAAPRGRALLRSGARAGDMIYVTGALGGAAAELAALEAGARGLRGFVADAVGHPHFFPQPRLAAGQGLLRRKLATACIDISDGLSVDLLHLCEESGLAAELNADAIPLGAGASLEHALHGGDDYELLFTARPGTRVPKSVGGVVVHAIGRMVQRTRGASRMVLVQQLGSKSKRSPLSSSGWQHF